MKQVRWMGIILFTILGIASLILYCERVLYLDSAYYAFQMINKEWPAIGHNRYAMYLYQIIPWIMLKLNMPIPWILMAFSVCHILLQALVFYILLRIKQPGLAILLVLMQVIAYRECFYLAVNETALAISASLLLAGLMAYFQTRRVNTAYESILYVLCILTALYSHPMSMILLPFVITYHIVMNKPGLLKKQTTGLVITIFLAILLLRKLESQSSGYEDDLFAQLEHTGAILGNLSNVYSFTFFFWNFNWKASFFGIYFIPVLVFLFCLFRLFKNRQYRLLAFYAVSTIGFWFIIIIFFHRGDGTMFMEKNFTPWVMVALYPLAFFPEFREEKLKPLTTGLLACIILISLWGILRVTPKYKQRIILIDQLITVKNPSGAPKLILQDSTVDHEKWLGVWALPYETLLLSKVNHLPNTTARIYSNEWQVNRDLDRTDIFIGTSFEPILPATQLLNQKYFKLENTKYLRVENP